MKLNNGDLNIFFNSNYVKGFMLIYISVKSAIPIINSIHKGFSTFFCKFRLSLNCNHVVRNSLIRLFRICSQILLNIREHDVFVNSLVFLMTSNKTVQILISIYYIHSGVSPINPDRSMIFYLHDTYDAITTKNFG